MEILKNKKGFTLIELLAVIVILGIVMAIVAVNVLPFIEDSRIGALETTANTIIDAAAMAAMAEEMSSGTLTTDCYEIEDLIDLNYLSNVSSDAYEGKVVIDKDSDGIYTYTLSLYDENNEYGIYEVVNDVTEADIIVGPDDEDYEDEYGYLVDDEHTYAATDGTDVTGPVLTCDDYNKKQ